MHEGIFEEFQRVETALANYFSKERISQRGISFKSKLVRQNVYSLYETLWG